MAFYRKKPVTIEAIQWTGDNTNEILNFGTNSVYKVPECHDLIIHTLEGDMKASEGDYIIKGVDGEFYACKPGIFEKTYEKV